MKLSPSGIVDKSAPNPDRPRLPEEMEAQLHAIDKQSAAVYAELEAVVSQLDELIIQIEHNTVPVAVSDNDSTLYHVENVQAAAARRSEDPEE